MIISTINSVKRIFVTLLIAMPVIGCAGNRRDFLPLGTVTSANLWISASDGSEYGWKISNPQDLSRIVTFVDSQRTDWGTPWFGVPVPNVEVQFFEGQQTKGSFGAGKDFFEIQRNGGFFSKSASPTEDHDFFDALNLDDATVKKYTK